MILDQNAIKNITNKLIKTYNPNEIYLLEPHNAEENDIDILIIIDNAPTQRYDLIAEGHKALIGIKFPKNILVYTKEEFLDYSQDKSTLSYLIKQKGKLIYAKS